MAKRQINHLTTTVVAKECDVSGSTVRNWIDCGISNGLNVVKLPAQKMGGRYHIQREDLEWFLEQCKTPTIIPRDAPTPTQRDRENARLNKELEDAGW